MITPEILKKRRNYICSSDPAKIMGISPFEGAYDAYLSKTNDMEPSKPTEAADIGNALEDDIVFWTAKKFNVEYTAVPDELWHVSKEYPRYACNLDALVLGDKYKTAIEAKFTSQIDEWGTGEETIPDHFMMQVQEQMMVMGYDYILIGVWIAHWGIERRTYVIKRNQKMIDRIERYCTWFWDKHVLPKVPPKDSPIPEPKTFSRIPKIEGKTVDISSESWLAFTEAKEAARVAGKAKDLAMSKVRAELGDAQCGRVPGETDLFYGTINGKTRTFKGER